MKLRSLWGWNIPQGVYRTYSGPSLGVGEEQEALLSTSPIHLRPPVPSPLQSVGMWAPGTYQVIRATQQAGRGLREGPVEAAALAGSCLPSSRGQGREAGLWGPLSACFPPSGKHRLSSSRQRALGRSRVLLPHAGTPWPARPRLGLQPLWRCV